MEMLGVVAQVDHQREGKQPEACSQRHCI